MAKNKSKGKSLQRRGSPRSLGAEPKRDGTASPLPGGRMTRSRTKGGNGRTYEIDQTQMDEQKLEEQLNQIGLTGVSILGDGNCMFRALSDQYFGTVSKHHQVRKDICDYVSMHADRYSVFIDDESEYGGFDNHVENMRRPGTYGTHIELSAFSQRYKRPVIVFQPDLVYVIDCDGPWAESSHTPPPPPIGGTPKKNVNSRKYRRRASENPAVSSENQAGAGEIQPVRGSRASRRLRKPSDATSQMPTLPGAAATQAPADTSVQAPAPSEGAIEPDPSEETSNEPIYVAYHSWEHYSSIRNIKGPRFGLPKIPKMDSYGEFESNMKNFKNASSTSSLESYSNQTTNNDGTSLSPATSQGDSDAPKKCT